MNGLPSGSTSDCLQDLFERYEWDSVRHVLADFTVVGTPTVRRWKVGLGEGMPKGEALLRLRVFLDLVGYKVDEFESLPPVTKQFTRLIAVGLLSIEGARELLQYTNPSEVFRVILDGSGLLRERVFRLERFVEDSHEELARYPSKSGEHGFSSCLSLLHWTRTGSPRRLPCQRLLKQKLTPTLKQQQSTKSIVPEPLRDHGSEDVVVRSVVNSLTLSSSLLEWLETYHDADELLQAVRRVVGTDQLHSLVDSLRRILK